MGRALALMRSQASTLGWTSNVPCAAYVLCNNFPLLFLDLSMTLYKHLYIS